MSDKKNIDRLFQEGFKDYEVRPPAYLWDQIESELDKKNNRKVIPLWWRFAGIAAGLAILMTAFYFGFNGNQEKDNQQIVISQEVNETEKNSINSSQKNSPSNDDNINNENNDFQLATEDSRSSSESLNDSIKNADNKTERNSTSNTNNLVSTNDRSSDTNKIFRSGSKAGNTHPVSISSNPNAAIAQKNNSFHAPVDKKPAVVHQEKSSHPTAENADQNVERNNSILKPVEGLNKTLNNTTVTSLPADAIKQKLKSLEEYAAQEEAMDGTEENAFNRRWAASTQVGPVYSNSLSGSAINEEVSSNNRDAGLNLSYGIGLSYEISPRLSVRTGVNQVNLAYNTQDINYRVSVQIASRGQDLTQNYSADAVRSALPLGNNPISSDMSVTGFAAQEIGSNQFQGIKGELSQQLGYIEIPLELKYSLINRKVQLNVLGGMSALFLTDNVVSVQNANQRLELGEDTNFNDFNQSANFGLGLGYDFTNQLGAFIEPTFKYQLSTLKNNAADFKPYTIGVQSGITFKF